MKKFILLTALLNILVSNVSFSQAKIENKLKFYEAEGYVLFEEYKEALKLYQELIKSYPNNSNLKFRIGQCYINIPAEKDKSLAYLEDAVKNINPDYKEGKFRETGAPFDAYYYLANAYRINNQIDKALETYELFNKNLDTKVYRPAIVDLQIQSCLHAKELMKTPLYIRKENLGDIINDQYPDLNPVVSGDQSSMVYNRLEPFQEALYYVKKVDGRWSNPLNIIPDLGLGQEAGNYATSLSHNGNELYIYRRGTDYDGNIYVTRKISSERWSNIVKLNDNINTKYWESHATLSHDGKKLYFTSNRKGTLGGLDIYVSERDSADAWGPATNLGPVINTEYNEDTPFLSENDKTLFFSSAGHYNIGGYDIFYSTLLEDGQWSTPMNIGYPLNTTDDDLFFHPLNDGYQAYYAMISDGGFGQSDIYRIEIFSDQNPRKFTVKGNVKVADLNITANDSVLITSTNLKEKEKSVVTYSDPVTGNYEFEAQHGDYEVTFEAPNSEKVSKELNLSLTATSDTFMIPGVVLPKTDFVADFKVNSARTSGDTLVFPLKTEPKSLLTVEKWTGDSLISSESFVINDTVFNFKMAKQAGIDKLKFRLTDKYGNITTTQVPVVYEAPEKVVRPEYSSIIAKKQIAAFTGMQKNRADDKLKRIIEEADIENHQFGTVDDVVSYIKDRAAQSNIKPEDVDKLALKIAVMDNVLTQAAVDLLEKYADGDMKKILSEIDIYKLKLKTWTDLRNYIISRSGGKLTAEDLNNLAAKILAEKEPEVITPVEPVVQPAEPVEGVKLWYLWLLLGMGLILFIILFKRKKDKGKKS
ncbi:MAG: tetratricopeptide repeat protein [Bacteroidia bacterium]|nr:tetratricopeptide repeat protein [Bacteroidia bacterium]